jgi:hypothetical protein
MWHIGEVGLVERRIIGEVGLVERRIIGEVGSGGIIRVEGGY